MKILQICPLFPPHISNISSGVTNVVYNLSKELINKGHEVSIYTSAALNPDEKLNKIKNPVIIEGIKVYYFPSIFNYYTFFITPQIITQLRKHISEYDLIHLHDVRCFQSIAVHRQSKISKIPYVLQAHGTASYDFKKFSLKKVIDSIFGRKIFSDAKELIALNENEAMIYNKMNIDNFKINIIPNGVDMNNMFNVSKKGEFRSKYGIKQNEKIVLYLGRLHESKGIDLIIESFYLLSNQIEDVKLVIAGPDDGFKKYLEKLTRDLHIENKVIFTGPLYDYNKISAYKDADVFVTPNYTGFPITFLESCSCGTPIVTTNKGDTLDWINNEVGFVVNYDKNSLFKAIYTIITDSRLREKFSDAGQSIVKKRFSWKEVAKNVENVYIKALK